MGFSEQPAMVSQLSKNSISEIPFPSVLNFLYSKNLNLFYRSKFKVINLDKNIERTALRPLTSKKISIFEAVLLLFVLL